MGKEDSPIDREVRRDGADPVRRLRGRGSYQLSQLTINQYASSPGTRDH